MNDKDKAVFETAYSAYERATNPELAGCKWTGMKLFEKALAHRDEQVAGLVEALKKITKVNGGTPVKTYQEMELIAKEALAAWEANK